MTTPIQNIPYGFCQCGCGYPTKIAKINTTYTTKRGIIRRTKGQSEDFLVGHFNRIIPIIEDAVPFKIEGIYCRLIPLTRSLWAIVDASDYIWLMRWKWCAAWSKKANAFYAVRDEDKHRIFMHQMILGRGADHKNRLSLDNRRTNLRPATRRQNNCNKGPTKRNKSGYKGVSKARNKWVVFIEDSWVGSFDVAADAARAYDREAIKRFGEFAWLNFPEERSIHEQALLESNRGA